MSEIPADNHSRRCDSCSMPIESGSLCQHCSDDDGNLIDFDECLERFMQWTRRNEPDLTEADATSKTLQFMASMPAWSTHRELHERLRRSRGASS